MSVHPEFRPHTGGFGHLKLGKKPPKRHPSTLRLSAYLTPALPTPPTKVVWGAAVTNYPMDGNDQYGNCTCAAIAHMIETWTAQAGNPDSPGAFDSPPLEAVMSLYWATGDPPNKPCPPGGPTDDGRACTDVLAFMQNTGIEDAGASGARMDKILGWAQINLANHEERDAAHWLFGGLYLGVALPLTAQNQTVWSVVAYGGADAEPGSWGGHCVPTVGRWPNTWEIVTWGARLEMTEAFFDNYVDEAYGIITEDWLNAQQASPVPGVNLALLKKDLADL